MADRDRDGWDRDRDYYGDRDREYRRDDDRGLVSRGADEVRSWFGDDEAPSAAPLLDLGVGRTVTDISTSEFHTCVVLDNGAVRCWGWGADGRLGYGNTADIGDDETPGSIDPVSLGTSPNYRPDGVISYTGYGRIGDGTYPPDQQDAYAHARVGVAMTFTVTVQNDGTGDDRFVLRGEGSTSNLAYRYRVGSTDITGAVKNGTFLTPVIAPRGKFKVTVTATYRAGTPRYTQVFRRLTVSSHTFPARTDSVRAAVAQY